MILALVKAGEFVRTIPVAGLLQVEPGLCVSPPTAGWQHGDWRIMEVEKFIQPDGKVRVGEPSYEIDGDKLIETYDVADPEPEIG